MTRHQKIALISLAVLAAIFFAALAMSQILVLKRAHSTFENYYAFRGCAELLSRTDQYGTCRLSSGQTVKIVKVNGRWYLDGDLPVCWGRFCL